MLGLRWNGAKEVKTRSPYLSLSHRFPPLARCVEGKYQHCFRRSVEASHATTAAPYDVETLGKSGAFLFSLKYGEPGGSGE